LSAKILEVDENEVPYPVFSSSSSDGGEESGHYVKHGRA